MFHVKRIVPTGDGSYDVEVYEDGQWVWVDTIEAEDID